MASKVQAGQYGAYGQYGSPTEQKISVDKLVARPIEEKGGTKWEYVDNLNTSDYKFSPDQYIFFKIKVKNTGDKEIFDILLKDYVPNFVDPVTTGGSYDKINRILTLNVGTLAPSEEKEFVIQMRAFPQDQLPTDKGLFCITNKAVAGNSDISDEDSAQACIERAVELSTTKEVKKIPASGPEYGLVVGAFSTFLGFAGLKLRKIS